MHSALVWLLITLFCVVVQGFYSMLEMASVSFNRVRLEYYVSKKVKRAIWLQYLLQKPSRLFGTIMLGVNIALQIGSQSSRELYQSLNLDPDWAPLTQIFLVVIVAELAPLFAARRFSEHVVMLGIPIVYATHRLFAPLIWLIGKMMNLVYRLFGKKEEAFDVFLSRDELQKVLESHEEEDEFNTVVTNIFSLRNKNAEQVMIPLKEIGMIPSVATVADLKRVLKKQPQPFVPLYHKKPANIVAIAVPRDLMKLPDNRLLRDDCRPPWFITSSSHLLPILSQFRENNLTAAVVLNPNGAAIGMLTLDAILDEVFGERALEEHAKEPSPQTPVIQRSFPGNTKIADFNKEYQAELDPHGVETLAQLMTALLDHPPIEGDAIMVDGFELTVEEATLMGIKTLMVKSI